MNWSLLNREGQRKYLTPRERAAFIAAAFEAKSEAGAFSLTLAFTGARISEALALTVQRLDRGSGTIVFETLKRRQKGIYRAVPVPDELIGHLLVEFQQADRLEARQRNHECCQCAGFCFQTKSVEALLWSGCGTTTNRT